MKTLAEPEVVKVFGEMTKEGISRRLVGLSDGTTRVETLSESGAWLPGGSLLDLFPTAPDPDALEDSSGTRSTGASSGSPSNLKAWGARVAQEAVDNLNRHNAEERAAKQKAASQAALQRLKPNPPQK